MISRDYLDILEWHFTVWEKGDLCYYHLVSEYRGALESPVLSPYYLLHDLVPLNPPSFSCFLQDLGQGKYVERGCVCSPL